MSRSGLSRGVDVCLDIPTDADRPDCPHGPTLLFTRYYADKKPRQFYACSACRDRKDCPFFQWADERVSEEKRKLRQQINAMQQPTTSRDQYTKRLEKFKKLPSDKERRFCNSCSELLVAEEWSKHSTHNVTMGIKLQLLDTPTKLLRPLEDEKTHAQYLFTDDTTQFLVNVFEKLHLSHVICIGTPRIHEYITNSRTDMKSFLLDIDYRYAQFFPPATYQRFNMFNFHFFGGHVGKTHLSRFLATEPSNVAFILDPPFGGIADILASTVKTLWALARDCVVGPMDGEFPTFWVFPYFLEDHVTKAMPTLKMLDYKVEYENHVLYKNAKKRRSPVRLFTNVAPEKVKLPASEGYRFCKKCRRYVGEENKHCIKCNSCTSKDGRTYTHCDQCNACVKPGRVHCAICDCCQPPAHDCTKAKPKTECHICGQQDHKRKSCPQRMSKIPTPASVKRKSENADDRESPKKRMKTEMKRPRKASKHKKQKMTMTRKQNQKT